MTVWASIHSTSLKVMQINGIQPSFNLFSTLLLAPLSHVNIICENDLLIESSLCHTPDRSHDTCVYTAQVCSVPTHLWAGRVTRPCYCLLCNPWCAHWGQIQGTNVPLFRCWLQTLFGHSQFLSFSRLCASAHSIWNKIMATTLKCQFSACQLHWQ